MLNPGPTHWVALKRILRYLNKTKDFALMYDGGADGNLKIYCDADWAGDLDGRRSTTGWAVMMCGAATNWKCELQKIIALSSTEAELVALSEAVKEAIWQRRLHDFLNPEPRCTNPHDPIVVHEDNQGAIALAQHDRRHGRTKHIDVKYFYVRHLIASGIVKLTYVPTGDQLADMLTKPLGRVKLRDLRARLGLVKLEQ